MIMFQVKCLCVFSLMIDNVYCGVVLIMKIYIYSINVSSTDRLVVVNFFDP